MRIKMLARFFILLFTLWEWREKKSWRGKTKRRWKVVFTASAPVKNSSLSLLKTFLKHISTHVPCLKLPCVHCTRRINSLFTFVLWFFMASRFELFWIHKLFIRQHLKFQCRCWEKQRKAEKLRMINPCSFLNCFFCHRRMDQGGKIS